MACNTDKPPKPESNRPMAGATQDERGSTDDRLMGDIDRARPNQPPDHRKVNKAVIANCWQPFK